MLFMFWIMFALHTEVGVFKIGNIFFPLLGYSENAAEIECITMYHSLLNHANVINLIWWWNCFILPINLCSSVQWMGAGRPGQSGLLVVCAVGGVSRSGPEPAPTQPLSMGGASVRACLCRRAPAMHSVQVSELCTNYSIIKSAEHGLWNSTPS